MQLSILFVSNQIRGIDGTGGLGDVPVGLSKVLAERNDIDIRLIMPGFANIIGKGMENRFDDANKVLSDLLVPFGDEEIKVSIYQVNLVHKPGDKNIICYLIRCPEVFDKDNDKNSPDKAIFFSRSVVEFLNAYTGFRVDLIHCNDWHTGLAPVYLKTLYRDDPYLGCIATLYTTHNSGGDAFQGAFPRSNELLSLAGLDKLNVFMPLSTRSLHHFDKFNFTKGGLGFADMINTVSHQYYKELFQPAFAGGLEGLFRERAADFTGIINGIDTDEWDPETDTIIKPYQYAKGDDVEHIIKQKQQIRFLLRQWGTPPLKGQKIKRPFAHVSDDSILIGLVNRIDYQKAPIFLSALDRICEMHKVQIILLGNTNDEFSRIEYEQPLLEKYAKYPETLFFYKGFDPDLSHLIYAASELFLVPSTFEPCGLTQLIAMRYGTIPVVRSVGGLVDTVIDLDDPARKNHATGFHFREDVDEFNLMNREEAARQLCYALERAVANYHNDRWKQLVKNCMNRDSSWHIPARQYVQLYQETIHRCMTRTFF
ncbi:MAG TPA: glycogen/starch synthase [bacterium]|nr:glycogen/starch synthase [bacterium]HPN43563.1 glycogen/starch synthase [bacterium]